LLYYGEQPEASKGLLHNCVEVGTKTFNAGDKMAESDYGFVTWRDEEMLRFERSGALQRDAMLHAS